MAANQAEAVMQALDQLLQLLRLPSSPEQEAQVISFLREHPSLMAAFINSRVHGGAQGDQAGDRGVDTGTTAEMESTVEENEKTQRKEED